MFGSGAESIIVEVSERPQARLGSMSMGRTCHGKHSDDGRKYAACGGETVTNLGLKAVKCLLPSDSNDNIIKTINFQVGDLVTRGLLAVSQVCSMGAGVWFGPAPDFRSFIVWDAEAFVASAGPKTELTMKNGTYLLPSREIFKCSSWGRRGGGRASPRPRGQFWVRRCTNGR